MMTDAAKKYVFSRKAEDVISHLTQYWTNEISSGSGTPMNPISNRWMRAFYLYYGFQFFNFGMDIGLSTLGDQGEMVGYAPNQYRNIIKTTLGVLTQNRVAFDVTSISDNMSDINISEISNLVLEHYLYSRQNEKEIKNAVEAGIVLGTVFAGWFWNEMARIVDVDMEGEPIWEGDFELNYFLPFDVRLETFHDKDSDIRWITFRRKVNRYELIGRYPEHEEALLKVESIPRAVLGNDFTTNEDTIWEKEIYHVSMPGMYKGRMIKYAGDVVLEDGANPYCNPRELYTGNPLARFRPDIIFGSSYGHTVAFDLLASQEYLGIIQSTIASSVNSMGTPNIIMPAGNSIDNIEEIPNGFRVIFYKPVEGLSDGGIPKTLNLLQLSSDLLSERSLVIQDMEQISGINSALRGNPAPGIQAASAIALLTTQAQTYNSSLEKNYVQFQEELGRNLLNGVAIFMKNKQLEDIVGTSNKYSVETFTGEALFRIKDIKLTVGNFLSKSLAGRLTMGEQLLNAQQINATEYAQILNTGQVSPILKDKASEENLISWENEELLKGNEVFVETTENHLMHMLKHSDVLKIPQVKMNLQLSNTIRTHIEKHQDEYDNLSRGNPQLLALITGSPIPPIPPDPGRVEGGEEAEQMVGGEAPTEGEMEEPGPTEQAAQQEGSPEALAGRAMRRASTEMNKAQMAG